MRTRAIGYLRFNTGSQSINKVSLNFQSDKIWAYANLNNFELVDIFCDSCKSGNTERDGLKHTLSMLDTSDASALIVYKLDRLSCSALEVLNLIAEIDSYGASLHSIFEELDTQSALGKYFVNMTASLPQLERTPVSERTILAMSSKKKQGQHCGSPAYGYQMVNKKLIPHPIESNVVSLINTMKADGATLKMIADELNKQGISTKRNSKWQPTQVSRVLAIKHN
jgi:site-specific DNA recombinase